MAGDRRHIAVSCALLVTFLGCAEAASWTESIDSTWADRWTHSTAEKYNGRFVAEAPPGLPDELALKVPEKARHYGIATGLPETVDPAEGIVLQYDLKIAEGVTCGGAYLKFLTADADIKFEELKDDSPYTVMFGPDKCGATNKVHLIIRHKSPLTGEIEEKHLKFPPSVLTDSDTHVYTAILHTNNTYDVLIDGESKKSGSIFDDFEPPFNPPAEIDDPDDKKPDDWVDSPKIADPEAVKPDDWDEDAPLEIEDTEAEKPEGWLDDEPDEIDDADAKQPEDWDEEEDGEWEPPRIPNPKCEDAPGCGEWKRPMKSNPAYKGKWTAPMIDNPAYKGVWKPALIPNPKYYKDDTPLAHIGKINAVAIEIWTMDSGFYFDDIVVANDAEVAAEFREKTYGPKKAAEAEAAEAKKAEEAAKKSTEDTADTLKDTVNDAVDKVFDTLGFLEPVRPAVQTAVDVLTSNPLYLYSAAGVPAALVLLLLLSSIFGGKKAAGKVKEAVGKAKKEDAVTADDKAAEAVEEEQEEEDEDEDEPAAANGTKAPVAARLRTARPRRDT